VKRILRRILAALTLAATALGLAGGVRAGDARARLEPWSKGTLDVHQISTGRGNAALVVFPDGTTLLYDAGDTGDGIPLATAVPDGTRAPGEWIARYVQGRSRRRPRRDGDAGTDRQARERGR